MTIVLPGQSKPNRLLSFAIIVLLTFVYLNKGGSDQSNLQSTINANHNTSSHHAVIYGHVHMAKTGGTNLNAMLANKFERVCGHKGYSYDYFQLNERIKNGSVKESDGKISQGVGSGFGRGRVPTGVMNDIGYENCDYISHESTWHVWPKTNTTFSGKLPGIQLELHVPCREPIDHILSQCNHKNKKIECQAPTKKMFDSVRGCFLDLDRFHMDLASQFHVKCFDFKRQFTNYTQYISNHLQHKRFESLPYTRRSTNSERNRTNACVWEAPDLREKIREYLIQEVDYYRFCNQCIGGENDIFQKVS